MEPLNRISINFQQIFKEDTKLYLQEQNSYTHSSSHRISLNDQPDNILQDTKTIDLNQEIGQRTMPILTENHPEKEIKPNKFSNKKELIVKKIGQGDSSKITEKLYHQKHLVCSKNHQKSVQNKQPPQSLQRNMKKCNRPNNYNCKNESKVHDRLYNMSKSQILKQIYFPKEEQKSKSKKKLSTVKSSKYLKNYVPLEKRVQEYLAQGQLQGRQSRVSKSSDKDFCPQLIRNKYTDKIQSKYNKSEIKQLRASQIAQFLNSSVSSSLSSQSRSASIIRRVEEHFLQKVRLIFVKKDHQIQISQQSISLLTDVQFHVLQPFIMQLQQSDDLAGVDFQQRFRSFYSSLPICEKMSLRNHEAKIKGKYIQLKQEVKQRKKQSMKIEPKKKIWKEEGAKKVGNKYQNYHMAFQQFI